MFSSENNIAPVWRKKTNLSQLTYINTLQKIYNLKVLKVQKIIKASKETNLYRLFLDNGNCLALVERDKSKNYKRS